MTSAGAGAADDTRPPSESPIDAISAQRLATVVPALAFRVERLMRALHLLGAPVRITQATRTLAEQQALYAQGRTAPGKRVTDADGLEIRSKHQDGRAVDFVWKLGDMAVSYNGPWELLGLAAVELGLRWGGHFSKPDRPHVELPAGMANDDTI